MSSAHKEHTEAARISAAAGGRQYQEATVRLAHMHWHSQEVADAVALRFICSQTDMVLCSVATCSTLEGGHLPHRTSCAGRV